MEVLRQGARRSRSAMLLFFWILLEVLADHQTDGFVVDTFSRADSNNLNSWHGTGEHMPVQYGDNYVELSPTDPDQNYHTQFSSYCFDMRPYDNMYLHVVFSGTDKFSISFNENNNQCDPRVRPYPATWDTVEAARYARDGHIYVPLSHFAIDMSKALSVSFHGFYTRENVTLYRVEIVPEVPRYFEIPRKLPSGTMVLRCRRPNSFAFGIDDGQPEFAQEVMQIIEEEGILVTFFVVGTGLMTKDTNFTEVYREMLRRGHQIALHSYTHPKMESLQSIQEIDEEILKSIDAQENLLGVRSRYFRPPFGTVGSRTRQRLAALIPDPYIVNWSVDIEDWLYADSDTPEKQLDAFKRDVSRGGDLVVMHYLSPSTVGYFREVIRIAKATGKRIMRVDQCMDDPDAPALPSPGQSLKEI
ncbi:CAZyme family CE4 [Paecilomyces variotii]|nr:CAZyme family CE4 [Paecilomyces variotii]